MLDNCFRFAPRDSIPGLIAKICKYLKDHPGWSEAELEEQINKFISSTGVESFNGRTGTVTLDKNDVNNLKIASAYFAEGYESIDSLDLVSLYNQGVRFVFTDFNSVTSGYNLAFVLDYFSGSGDVVYYPMSTGSGGGGNIVSVNGKTGVVELSLSDIIGTSGVQVKLCTETEFTSATTATWNAYYNEGYRIIGVVNSSSTAIDYIYLLKQDGNNHTPIGLSTGASDAYTPTNPPPYPVTSVNGKTGTVTGLYDKNNPPPYPVNDVNSKTGSVLLKVVDVSNGNSTDENACIFIDESDDYHDVIASDSSKLGGKAPEYYLHPRNLLDNSDFRNPVNQRGKTSYTGFAYTIDRWIIWSSTGTAKLEKENGYLFVNPNGESDCSISQRIPKGLAEQSKTYTKVLCRLDGSIEVSTAGIVYGDNYDLVDFHITSAANIIWAALYEGSYTYDTLPPYVPKGYATELAECQRYFERIGKSGDGSPNASMLMAVGNAGEMRVLQGYRVPKRIISPTIMVNGKAVGETVSVRNSLTNEHCTGVLSVWNNTCADRLNTLTIAGTSVAGAVYEGYLDIIADL